MVLGPMLRYDQKPGQVLKAFAGIGAIVQLRPQSFEVSSGNRTPPKPHEVTHNSRLSLMAERGLAIGGNVFRHFASGRVIAPRSYLHSSNNRLNFEEI